VKAQEINGLTIERVKNPGAGPLLFIEIPGTKADAPTVFMYGHMDKQPPMEGWEEGTGPYEPVLKDDLLYGRGTVDDGYSIYAGLLSIKAI
jgi:acetylornithine deacetylase/succinyl-diaminopimelate desuccinylase-like protein